nr:MAG TPA: hypothetical protein [Caudoviricetes sp.]
MRVHSNRAGCEVGTQQSVNLVDAGRVTGTQQVRALNP